MVIKLLDTSPELQIYCYRKGIKLVKPESNPFQVSGTPTGFRVKDILNLPCNVFFLNYKSEHQNLNESEAEHLGALAAKDVLGKSVSDFIHAHYAKCLLENDQDILLNQHLKILSEECVRLTDNVFWQALSIKMPWYNEENKLIGTFGLGIVERQHSLPITLEKITKFGLLYEPLIEKKPPSIKIEHLYNNIHLTAREKEVLSYLIRGKTARDTANMLNLSTRTVEHYLESLKNKFDVSSKAALIEKIIGYLL